jgi:hypothetical protein
MMSRHAAERRDRIDWLHSRRKHPTARRVGGWSDCIAPCMYRSRSWRSRPQCRPTGPCGSTVPRLLRPQGPNPSPLQVMPQQCDKHGHNAPSLAKAAFLRHRYDRTFQTIRRSNPSSARLANLRRGPCAGWKSTGHGADQDFWCSAAWPPSGRLDESTRRARGRR